MEVRDRKKLARLMIVQEETHRSLSAAAGWKSHSYLGRLLRGEVKTLDTDAALRIAHRLRVPVDDLFVIRMDSNAGHNDQEPRPILDKKKPRLRQQDGADPTTERKLSVRPTA